MTRQVVRELKRAIAIGGRTDSNRQTEIVAREAALSLLARSIHFGHARLAVLRLSMAVQAGADIDEAHWVYCRIAAERSRDVALQSLFLAAASQRVSVAKLAH